MPVDNDNAFRTVLSGLTPAQHRQVGARFAENVLALSKDPRILHAVDMAKRADFSDDELDAAMQAAKTASVDSFTRCGNECNWNDQAGHFAAQSAQSCFAAAGLPAWDAAMHARMARTCEHIANGQGTDNAEAAAQYRILAEFLNA